tara:strand:+ start:518 stop:835 length:318 start_codon:yes stop_codon:yes gene_type:complete
MKVMDRKQNYLDILRSLEKKPNLTQRKLATKLGFSLGKLSYCLKSLQEKGLVKMKNFSKSKTKIKYIYKLTPHGIAEKTKLTINFMNKKMKEYEELKKELEKKNE